MTLQVTIGQYPGSFVITDLDSGVCKVIKRASLTEEEAIEIFIKRLKFNRKNETDSKQRS